MFGNAKRSAPQNSIDSLIGVGTRVDGDLVFRGGLRIDGEVHGSITCEPGQSGTLVISEKASPTKVVTEAVAARISVKIFTSFQV